LIDGGKDLKVEDNNDEVTVTTDRPMVIALLYFSLRHVGLAGTQQRSFAVLRRVHELLLLLSILDNQLLL